MCEEQHGGEKTCRLLVQLLTLLNLFYSVLRETNSVFLRFAV